MLPLVLAALYLRSLQPLRELPLPPGNGDFRVVAYARDETFEYLGTPDGLYRADRLATGAIERIGFGGETITALATGAGVLYVGKGSETTLLRSRDHGATFEPIDAGHLVPQQISSSGDRLFIDAGGNVLVSANEGASWSYLWGEPFEGKPQPMSCPITFERIGETMLIGGECPLDFGFIRAGRLRPDLLGWSEDLQLVATPDMENRNVQFIRDAGGGVVYAGVEGALLKSTDGGRSFRFVIHYDLDAPDRYPYIGHFVVSPRDPRLIVVGGFDKKNDVGYLAYSIDAGETWQDVSPLAGGANLVLLAADADGRILVGLDGGTRFMLAEAVLGERAKRRAVRP